jgi:hypothetical protein
MRFSPTSVELRIERIVAETMERSWSAESFIGMPFFALESFRSEIIKAPEMNITGRIKKSKKGFS